MRMNNRNLPVAMLLIGALFLSWEVSGGNSQSAHYWVRPDHDTMEQCPENISSQACFTISELVSTSNVTITFAPNTTIHFLPGEHTPDTSGWIESGNQVKHLYIVGEVGHYCSPSAECNVVINCTHVKIGFAFISLTTASMDRIDISHCGFFIHDLVRFRNIYNNSLQPDCRLSETTQPKSSILIYNVTRILLSTMVTDNSSGYGLLILLSISGLESIINISNSTFTHSNWVEGKYLANSSIGGNIAMIAIFQSKSAREVIVYWSETDIFITNVRVMHGTGSSCWDPTLGQFLNTGGGLTISSVAQELQRNIVIDNSTFSENKASIGGGLHVTIMIVGKKLAFEILITNCVVHKNRALLQGGGLYLMHSLSITLNYELSFWPIVNYELLSMKNTDFSSNEADLGGAVYMSSAVYVHRESVLITIPTYDLHYTIEERCVFYKNRAVNGASLLILINKYNHVSRLESRKTITVNVRDTQFTANTASDGGVIYIVPELKNFGNRAYTALARVYILSCHFSGNFVKGAVLSVRDNTTSNHLSQIVIRNSFLLQNYAPIEAHSHEAGAVIYIEKCRMDLENSRIEDNKLRAIYANVSDIKIRGQVWVVNNSAMGNAAYGGGIYLDDRLSKSLHKWCKIIIDENSTLHLTGNKANGYGGAIAIPYSVNDLKPCFFIEIPNSAIITMDNAAGIAGNAIFGGALETCTIHINDTDIKLNKEYFMSYFTILENETLSTIASIPYRVCVCNNQTHSIDSCNKHHRLSTFPGKLFHIPLIGVGHWNYPAPSVVRARLKTRNAKIKEELTTQDIGLICRDVPYLINTQLEDEEVNMTLVIETAYIQDSVLPTLEPAEVLIHILKCPYGFILNTISNSCNCTDHLNKAGLHCIIDTQRIHKHQYTWIGNLLDEIIVHNHCPFGYCKDDFLDIDPYNQQEQCNFNRSGVLCGACRPGLSLVLGTSQCKRCSNIYLLLLIPFALAGVALVVLLLKCNLTVSTGTINGLIFYANIVHENRSIFIPPNSQSTLVYIPSVLIAWLNLDLGIETCFAENLNTYTRTWLQFVFPIYIWLIVGILILVSHYSTTVSRLTGSNTVSVLATLFLLSYAKLLRTTFSSFNSSILTNSDGNESKVWLVDGNVFFLQWPHALLFTAAFIMVVIHILPFTALLLFSPLFLKYSHIKVFCWAAKLMPLLDAYHGPYKHKYRYWTGLMLLFRLILFTAFSSNVLGDPQINLLVIAISTTILLAIWIKVGRIYRNKLINVLELFFLINLLILAISTPFFTSSNTVTSSKSSQDVLVLLMVGSALAVFICILVYHCFEVIKHISGIKKLIEKIKSCPVFKRQSESTTPDEDLVTCQQCNARDQSVTCTVVELKEPLLIDGEDEEEQV